MMLVVDGRDAFLVSVCKCSVTDGRRAGLIIIIIIIIIQYLYSALKSCKGYGGAGGFRLRLV